MSGNEGGVNNSWRHSTRWDIGNVSVKAFYITIVLRSLLSVLEVGRVVWLASPFYYIPVLDQAIPTDNAAY